MRECRFAGEKNHASCAQVFNQLIDNNRRTSAGEIIPTFRTRPRHPLPAK